jgi:hypothetical protein
MKLKDAILIAKKRNKIKKDKQYFKRYYLARIKPELNRFKTDNCLESQAK